MIKSDTERGNKEERVRHVIATAKEQFILHGYSGTTTMQIAREAGISEMTLFRYFANKQDIFQAVVSPLTQFEWFPKKALNSGRRWPYSLMEFFNGLIAFAKKERKLVRMAIIESQLQPDLGGEYNPLENASSQLKSNLRAFGIDEESSQAVIHLIMSLILTIAFTPYYDEETIDLTSELMREQILDIITACCPSRGEKIMTS